MPPTIVTREQWGARAPRRPFTRRWRKLQGIVIHHSGVRNGPTGAKALKAFEKHHMDGRGWNGIAYNWLVGEDGRVYHGRGPGIVGGATKGYNSTTESICYTGWGGDEIPQAAQESLKWLVDHLQQAHRSGLWVKRHRDFASTTCPGGWLAQWVEDGLVVKAAQPDVKLVLQYLAALQKQVERRPLARSRRSRGDAVKVVQQRLKAHGHHPGPIDGLFGPATQRAVRAFQGAAGMKVDGVVGLQTWSALLS